MFAFCSGETLTSARRDPAETHVCAAREAGQLKLTHVAPKMCKRKHKFASV